VQSIVRDITERKQVEEKLRQQNQYLSILHQITLDLLDRRDMDELLQTVVDHAAILLDAPFSELMLEKDGELVVQTFTKNQEFLKGDRVGRAEAKLSWQAFDTKLPVVLDDYSAYSYRRDVYIETKLHAIAEFPVLIKDKCIGVVSMGRSQPGYAFSEMQVENGKLFAQLVAVVLDSLQLFSDAQYEISERKKSEESLMLAHDQAVKANKLKSQLIAKVSHELRTPLSSVLGYAELLKYNIFGGELNPQQMEATDQIIDSAHYLTDMVNEFLDEAEIESRSLILDHQPFVIADVLKYVEATMSIIADKKGLALKTSLAPDLPETVWGDARRLQQVLINLTNNAIKFTRSGEVSVGIRRHSASHWALEVKDTGVGIPKDAQEIIFEPFMQMDNAITRENQGTGLGLTITRQLVELMSGRIFVESEVEKGSAFTIVLPIQNAPKTQ
jgi:signal transduction histidine kinase